MGIEPDDGYMPEGLSDEVNSSVGWECPPQSDVYYGAKSLI